MKRKTVWNLALAGALLLGGCGVQPPAPTPVTTPVVTSARPVEQVGFALPCYPAAGFHPITGTNRLNLTLAPLLYRGLFTLDRQFEAQPELCGGYTISEDGMTWTFRLAAASFSDGAPLTAAEAAASLNAARQSERYRERLSGVRQVTAEGENALVITLSKPNGALPALLDVPIIKETEDPNRPLGTGAYCLREGGDGLSLQAVSAAAAPVETIPLRAVGASDDLIYAFDAGEITLVDTDLTSTDALGYSGRFETTDYPTTRLVYVGCNSRAGACKEQAVRQAVARAADREEMTRRILAGHGVASALPIHPNAPGYDDAVAKTLRYDKEAAGTLLEEAGWQLTDGRLSRGRAELSLKLIVNQDNASKVKMAEALGAELESLGCAVTVEKLPWDDFTTALRRGEFDLFLGESVLTADFDPETLLTGALNYGGFGDEETGRLLALYQRAAGEAREEAASALWAKVAELTPVVPLCFKNGSLLTRWGRVSGATPTQRDVFAGFESWTVARS